MTTQNTRKNSKFIILGLVALVVVGLFVYKIVVENKIKAWATEDLSLYEPLLKLESAKIEASYLDASVTYKDIVYSMPDVPTVKITIDKIIQEGLDKDTLMGKPGDTTTLNKMSISGLRMFVESMELPLMEIGHYEVSDMAFPYRDTRAALIANKDNPDHMGLFKAMAPIIEKAQMKSGTSVMRDFKINLRQGEFFDIWLEEATSSGLRSLSRETEGFDAAIDESALKNLQFSAEMPDGSELSSSLESAELKGMKYNYKEMMAALGELNERSDPFAILMAVIPSLYNYKFDSLVMNGLTVNAMGGVFTLDSINLGPRTLKEQGPNLISGMKAVMNGMEVFSLESMGMDKLILSDVIVDFINRPAVYMDDRNLLESISENPFVALDGIKLDNLFVRNLSITGMGTLDNWSSNVNIQDSVNITSKIDKLHVSPMALRQAFMFTGGGAAMDILGVLASNPDGMLLDSEFFSNVQLEANSVSYELNLNSTIAGQGNIHLNMSGITDEPEYSFQTYGEPLLRHLEISIRDDGILANSFNYMSKRGLADSSEGVKAILVQDIDTALPKAAPNEATILRGVRNFVENGGKLDISLKLPTPMHLNDLDTIGSVNDIVLEVINSK